MRRGRRRAVRAAGPLCAARGFPLHASLNNKGDIFYLFFRLQIHPFHIHVFTRHHFLHLQIGSRNCFSDTIPLRFTIYDFMILTRHTLYKGYTVSL